jgi:hypothetical protein
VILGAGAGERSDDPMDEGNVVSRIPQSVSALCVAGTAGCDARPDDRCDGGGSAPADAIALSQAQDAVDASCPCAAVDGCKGQRYESYVHCAQRVLRAAVHSGRLRRRCKQRAVQRVTTSTCGRPGAVVCCQTEPANRCLVTSAAACISVDRRVRTSCDGATSCAATTCLSAGICEAGG